MPSTARSLWTCLAWTTGSHRRVAEPCALGRLTQYATVLCSGCVSLCYGMLAFIRDYFVTSYEWPNPVTVDALGVRNGPAMA